MLVSISVDRSCLRPEIPQARVSLRPLKAGERIEFGDYVQTTPFPNFEAGRVVHGRKVLPSEAQAHKFWREL